MINRNHYIIEISLHAQEMARERGITFDMIESTIKTGRIERFGKNGIKFISKYKRGSVICLGERKFGNYVKIITIEG
jgi:hypothetical protein